MYQLWFYLVYATLQTENDLMTSATSVCLNQLVDPRSPIRAYVCIQPNDVLNQIRLRDAQADLCLRLSHTNVLYCEVIFCLKSLMCCWKRFCLFFCFFFVFFLFFFMLTDMSVTKPCNAIFFLILEKNKKNKTKKKKQKKTNKQAYVKSEKFHDSDFVYLTFFLIKFISLWHCHTPPKWQ